MKSKNHLILDIEYQLFWKRLFPIYNPNVGIWERLFSSCPHQQWTFIIIFSSSEDICFHCFLERGTKKERRERETSMWARSIVCLPPVGAGLGTRPAAQVHAPTRVEPAASQPPDHPPTNWATLAGGTSLFLIFANLVGKIWDSVWSIFISKVELSRVFVD